MATIGRDEQLDTGTSPAAAGPIPAEVEEVLNHRLAELRPLHDEYTHLVRYRQLVGAARQATDDEPAVARQRATPGIARGEILAALAQGPRTSEQLQRELTVTPETLRYNLRRLTRTGVIVKASEDDSATYALTRPAVEDA